MYINNVKQGSRASTVLDLLRFVAAFLVVVYHGGIDLIPGYEAVMVFFVLSGYFISSSVIKSIVENRWSWKIYLVNRLSRLWIVLFPALLLSLFWANLRIGLFDNGDKFAGVLDWKVFISNLFFLQGVTSPIFGMNGPLWSLSYEFWYYILFPCIVHIFYARKFSTKIVYAVIVISLSLFLGEKIMLYFPIWLLGSLIVVIKPMSIQKVILQRVAVWSSSLFAFISVNLMFLFFHTNHPKNTISQLAIDYIVGFSFMILFYVIISVFNNFLEFENSKIAKLSQYLAGFSYTLYLTHYPFLQFIRDYTKSPNFDFNLMILAPLILVAAVLYAWLISRITEVHTDKVRNFIMKFIKGKNHFFKRAA